MLSKLPSVVIFIFCTFEGYNAITRYICILKVFRSHKKLNNLIYIEGMKIVRIDLNSPNDKLTIHLQRMYILYNFKYIVL